jgi:hypothetical protein
VARADELLQLFERTGVGPEHIARAIRKGLESKRPSARYVAPWRTYFGLWFFRIMPTSWMDAILRVATGLTPKTLKALPKQVEAHA